MNKKQTIKKTAALLLGLAIAMGTTGCGFITTDSQKDLDQTVAKVDITASDEFDSTQAEELKKLNLSGEVKKREMISYYMSVGYQYVSGYGYTYEEAFTMILTALVNKETLVQEAAAYFLKNTDLSGAACEAYVTAELAGKSAEEKALLEKYGEVLTLKYLLTNGGTEMKDYDIAEYTLKKNINKGIDSLETSYIKEESDNHGHGETRTLPTGVNTEIEDYYTTKYEVYTGRNAADACGEYKKVNGSTVASRQKAYNAFLTNLQDYNLVSTTGKVENTSNVTSLEYYYVELASLLEQRLINKYYEALDGEIMDKLNAENGKYVSEKYAATFDANKQLYEKNPTSFAAAMDNVSADSMLLYAPYDQNAKGEDMIFGYVYNILLPFSTSQSIAYTEAQNRGLTANERYSVRREIGANVKGKDLRTSWISMHDHANHSYEQDGAYYFFADNNGEKYEKLTQYAGKYAFNGTVTAGEDDYELKANELDIDAFMTEFNGHINKVVGSDVASGSKVAAYETSEYKNADGDIDYSKFIYYTGKVNFSEAQTAAGFFNPETEQYKALSAVNELMFAYSTDSGCLNTYMGYSVSPYGTNFVKEFEKAAQDVVKAGVGNYAVCLTDYGWHIVYCSFSYTADYMGDNTTGDVYGGYNHAEKDTEGTFSNLFYEYIKDAAYSNYTSEIQSRTLKKYENCVERFENRYEDLYKGV